MDEAHEEEFDVGLLRELVGGAVEKATPLEVAAAQQTIRDTWEALPRDYPANSARILENLILYLGSALRSQVERLHQLGIEPDTNLDVSETLADRALKRSKRIAEQRDQTAPPASEGEG